MSIAQKLICIGFVIAVLILAITEFVEVRKPKTQVPIELNGEIMYIISGDTEIFAQRVGDVWEVAYPEEALNVMIQENSRLYERVMELERENMDLKKRIKL